MNAEMGRVDVCVRGLWMCVIFLDVFVNPHVVVITVYHDSAARTGTLITPNSIKNLSLSFAAARL